MPSLLPPPLLHRLESPVPVFQGATRATWKRTWDITSRAARWDLTPWWATKPWAWASSPWYLGRGWTGMGWDETRRESLGSLGEIWWIVFLDVFRFFLPSLESVQDFWGEVTSTLMFPGLLLLEMGSEQWPLCGFSDSWYASSADGKWMMVHNDSHMFCRG